MSGYPKPERRPKRRRAYGSTLAASEPMSRRPMSRESTKGRAERLRWQADRDAHLAVEPTCQAPRYGLPQPCWGVTTVHHVRVRGMGGRRGNTGPLVTLCAGHHRYVEDNRAEARGLGLLVRRRDNE